MKDKLAKIFPIAVGIAIGWLLVYPPDWLAPLGPVRYLVVFLLAIALVIGASALVILKNLPEQLEITQLDEALPEGLEALAARFENLGFTRAGPPCLVQMSPAATLLGLVHEELPIYAAIYRTGTIPAVTTFDLVSILSDERGGLTTTPEPRGVALPAFPGSLRQAIAGASVEDIWTHHRQAMDIIAAKGLSWRRLAASDLLSDMRRSVARQRSFYLQAPLRNTIVTIWRSAGGRCPEARPLPEQPDLEANLRKIITGATLMQ